MLGLVDNKFLIGRDSYSPISAEVHYFRVPKRYWSICFERIKKAGFRIISSFVPWNLHEERPGEFDFQGFDNQFKDLIVFLELAREFGFKIILRPGPWIQSEWPNGGLPKYIFNDESLIARDCAGGLLMAENSGGVKAGYQPSYLHPKYVNHVKRYIGGLVEAIQNYIFPKGPVFLIQLDNEINFGSNYGLFEADYNANVVNELFPAFLESKYESVKNLPACYGKEKSFNDINPPVELILKKNEHLIQYFDWLEFKGKMLEEYITILKDRWESLGVGCMFLVAMPISKDFVIPIPWEKIKGERTILGVAIDHTDDTHQIARKVRINKNLTGYSWSSQLAIGMPQVDNSSLQKVDYRYQRFQLISALAAGMKGLNYYMFVGRNLWTGSPLNEDGAVNSNYDYIRKLNIAFDIIDLSSTKSNSAIAIGLYKPYQWYNQITSEGEFGYINDLINQTFAHLSTDFSNLNYDYEIFNLETSKGLPNAEEFGSAKILFVPCADYMDEELQERLVEIINNGMIVVLVGLLPRYNLTFKPAKILSKKLGLQTKMSYNAANVNAGNYSFKSLMYGYMQNRGSAKTIANAGNKVVGVYKKLGKGKFYCFTYDMSASSEPGKLSFIKDLLIENNIPTLVSCSDPETQAVVQANDKGAIFYLINTGSGQSNSSTKKVVVALDLSQVGFRQAKMVLHDIFDPDNIINSTSHALKEGLIFEMGHLDARIYWIPRK
ncbi:MAG: beta-galactosidase [candidate division Zixibacteria bacterium]|nr:beta-galactosidase [candidate division Zixibacteria bacterium]